MKDPKLGLAPVYQNRIVEYGFAFTSNPIPGGIMEYLKAFGFDKRGASPGCVRTMVPYEFVILREYRERIYNTFSLIMTHGMSLATIIQFGPIFHGVFHWTFNEALEGVVLMGELFTTDMSLIPPWIEKNKEFEVRGGQSLGFGK